MRRSLSIGVPLLILAAAIGYAVWHVAAFDRSLSFPASDARYANAHHLPTQLPAREWMAFAMTLPRDSSGTVAIAARLYAYTASVYADVLEATGSEDQAGLATTRIISALRPKDAAKAELAFARISSGGLRTLSAEASDILERYIARAGTDGADVPLAFAPAPRAADLWYRRGSFIDTSAGSGSWKPWFPIASSSAPFPPPPPAIGSLEDRVDLEKARYAENHKDLSLRLEALLWSEPSLIYPQATTTSSIGVAGLWQNILFIEAGTGMTDREYARAQKLLAESITDAYGYAWRAKYAYYRQSPSMRLANLDLMLSDPLEPSYISEQATVSATAATVLSSLFPAQEAVWQRNAENARASRLIAGVEFYSDGAEGARGGAALGKRILAELSLPDSAAGIRRSESVPELALMWAALRVRRAFDDLFPKDLFEKAGSWFSSIRFEEVATDAKLPVSASRYVAWTDYDGDGRLDLLAGTRLFRNTGSAFEERKSIPDAPEDVRSLRAFADTDNDGCQDLFRVEDGAVSVYRGDCAGGFKAAGTYEVTIAAMRSRGIAFSDYDRDGYLDLFATFFITSSGLPDPSTMISADTVYAALLHNDGHGGFTVATAAAGIKEEPSCSLFPRRILIGNIPPAAWYQPVWFDYDRDGLPDLYIPNEFWIGALYRNNGDGTFTDATERAGLCRPGTGMGAAVGDVDGDGRLDLYVTNVGANYLWVNQPDGTFVEEATERAATDNETGWGVELADLDNDGDLDIYIANASIPFFRQVANVADEYLSYSNLDSLLENDGGGRFHPVTEHAGIGGSYLKYNVGAADYDNDGRLDLYVAATAHPEGTYNSLYRNVSATGNHWLTLRLVGTKSNRDGVGAVATLTAGGTTQVAELLRGSSFLSQDSPWLHFGIGKASAISSLSIRWPSGTVQEVPNPNVDQLLTITEPR